LPRRKNRILNIQSYPDVAFLVIIILFAIFRNFEHSTANTALRLSAEANRASSMTEKKTTELTRRAYDLGFRRGYEIANRTRIDAGVRKDEFVNKVLEAAQNSLESTVFESIAAELDSMNAKYPAFDGWTVFAEGIIEGAGENFLDRTGSQG
jgi:hypothetical protein